MMMMMMMMMVLLQPQRYILLDPVKYPDKQLQRPLLSVVASCAGCRSRSKDEFDVEIHVEPSIAPHGGSIAAVDRRPACSRRAHTRRFARRAFGVREQLLFEPAPFLGESHVAADDGANVRSEVLDEDLERPIEIGSTQRRRETRTTARTLKDRIQRRREPGAGRGCSVVDRPATSIENEADKVLLGQRTRVETGDVEACRRSLEGPLGGKRALESHPRRAFLAAHGVRGVE